MFWKKKESKIVKELTESVVLLEKKVMSIEIELDNFKIRYKKRMFPKAKTEEKDIYKEQLLPM